MKKPPVTILSVDWDWFLPREIDTLDWGHCEEQFHLLYREALWPGRANGRFYSKDPAVQGKCAFDAIQVDQKRVETFWDTILGKRCRLFNVAITDSHKDIVNTLSALTFHERSKVRVINFDAHHDAGYPPGRKLLDCGNWAEKLRASGRLVSYELVYPAWRKDHPEWSKDGNPTAGIDEIHYGAYPKPLEPLSVFLCRSSCWMPSWCDSQWLALRERLLERVFDKNMVIEAPYIRTARPFVREQPIDWSKVPVRQDGGKEGQYDIL